MEEGKKMYKLAQKIFPIFRCLMGSGVRETLEIIKEYLIENANVEMQIIGVPSGTKVFDWKIPEEWIIKKAYIENQNGERIVDIEKNNLYVVGYSAPIDKWVTKKELNEYVYVQEEQPDVIPYVTSYYKKQSGFCMSKNDLQALHEGKYHLVIDSKFIDGELTYGEVFIPGLTDEEVFFSTYICHPSMANNECSGPALMTEIISYIQKMNNRRYSYRFIFIPETIGSLTYMSQRNNLERMREKVIAGFNLTCVGDDNAFSLVHSRYADTYADRILENILKYKKNFTEYNFLSRGSDERQYCAPGIDLPIVTFCRSKFHEYAEYHTSADDMKFISSEGLQGSYDALVDAINLIEKNEVYCTTVLGEPQMGKRGLYPTISKKGNNISTKNMMNFLAYADGRNDLIQISDIIGVPVNCLIDIADKLLEEGLIQKWKY